MKKEVAGLYETLVRVYQITRFHTQEVRSGDTVVTVSDITDCLRASVLIGMCGPDREKWQEVGRKLQNVQLRNLYRSSGILCFRGLFNDAVSSTA
jgi:hypothetical protein